VLHWRYVIFSWREGSITLMGVYSESGFISKYQKLSIRGMFFRFSIGIGLDFIAQKMQGSG
jgi:hypothetical protein